MGGKLSDMVIIVAGAGAIGGELARRYAAEGASVVLGDIDGTTAECVAKKIVEAGGSARGIPLDGSDDQSVKEAVELTEREFGGLDGFHANFATFADGVSGEDVLSLPLEVYDEVMRINTRGFLLCTRHAVPAMKNRGGGSILYTSSSAAHMGEAVRVGYAMSKAALHALMRHVASRFGGQRIRANAIAPGIVAHPGIADVLVGDLAEHFRQGNPLKAFGSPQDIAAMAAFLMSEEARYITGQVVSVDGGASMRP